MHRGNSHKHEISKDSKVTLGINDIFEQRRKGEDRVLVFRSENWEIQVVKKEQHTWQEHSC